MDVSEPILASLVNCVILLLPKLPSGMLPLLVLSSNSILLPSVSNFSPLLSWPSNTILILCAAYPVPEPIKYPVSVSVSKSKKSPSSVMNCRYVSNTNSSAAELCSNTIPPSLVFNVPAGSVNPMVSISTKSAIERLEMSPIWIPDCSFKFVS